MAGDDFVMVQLTDAGKAMADGATLRVSGLRRHFVFEPEKPLRVERSYEWRGILAQQFTPRGEAIFELVPADPAAGTQASATPHTSEETK